MLSERNPLRNDAAGRARDRALTLSCRRTARPLRSWEFVPWLYISFVFWRQGRWTAAANGLHPINHTLVAGELSCFVSSPGAAAPQARKVVDSLLQSPGPEEC